MVSMVGLWYVITVNSNKYIGVIIIITMKLDAEISEKVMGLTYIEAKSIPERLLTPGYKTELVVKPYSTSLEKAGLVVKRMHELGFTYKLSNLGTSGYAFEFMKVQTSRRFASIQKTVPLAVCNAALKAFAEE